MFKEKIKHQLESTLLKIDESKKLEETDKVLYRDLLQDCAENTNGKTAEEKLQNTTETVFTIVQLLILDKLADNKNTIWNVIKDCKWALVIIVAILSLTLIFRPELASLLTALCT